jgi:hypothetical protein
MAIRHFSVSLGLGMLINPGFSFKFSTLVVFGDSYTDQGVHSYTPDANGTVGTPVR